MKILLALVLTAIVLAGAAFAQTKVMPILIKPNPCTGIIDASTGCPLPMLGGG